MVVQMGTAFRKLSLSACSALKFRKFNLIFMAPSLVIRYSVFIKLNFLNSVTEQVADAKLSKHSFYQQDFPIRSSLAFSGLPCLFRCAYHRPVRRVL
jgi:hypothetical protein